MNNSDDMMMETVPAGARVVVLDGGLTSLSIDADYIGEAIDIAVSAAGRSGVFAEHIYMAAHLRPLSVVHVSSTPAGEKTEISWIPRNLDNSDDIDPSAQFEISWLEGTIITTGTSALLPIVSGSNTQVTIKPTDLIGGFGAPKTIQI